MSQLDHLTEAGLLSVQVDGVKGNGREFVSADQRWLDFCSCNYLGFDREPALNERGIAMANTWGPISGWSRLEAEFSIYNELERKICQFIGVSRLYQSHSITSTNFSVIPLIAKKGVIFSDYLVHTVVWEACRLAKDHGAKLVRWRHQDLAHLEELLIANRDVHPKVIAVDGVYSITTELAPIRELQELCRRYDAWLYVDDAHGFGILGDNPTAFNQYGVGGTGVVRRAGGDFERTFYVSSFGKAFCTMTAFATIPEAYTENIAVHAMTNIFSSPLSPYTVGTVMAALDLNASQGEDERAAIRSNVAWLTGALRNAGLIIESELDQPIFFVEVGPIEKLEKVAEHLKKRGILAGLRPYPVVPADRCGLRFAVHSRHDRSQLTRVVEALTEAAVRPLIRQLAASA